MNKTVSEKILLLFVCVLFSNFILVAQDTAGSAYRVETIEMPHGLTAQVGGMDFLPDGRLIACFMRGEVMTYDLLRKEWKVFAEGFQLPLGLLAINNSEVMVMHTPNLMRIKDTDGDGIADLYENATDDFGISGNYHEFNYGPARDKNDNFYIALNTASSGGGVRPVVRGKLNERGRDSIDGRGQMFSVVPYRGWVMQLTKKGDLIPYASGFRSPNGIGFDLKGNLLVTDNQSDWVPTSSLCHVQKGKFYGHAASLVWKKEWNDKDPFNAPVHELDKMRTMPAVLFPQGIMANSPSQPLADNTDGKFGPFTGQIFIGEINRDRIVRVILEEVDGELQGACIPFVDGHGLRAGNNRLAFAHDGSLWVGQIGFGGWVGESGIQRIVYSGSKMMEVLSINLTMQGFDLTFTQPVDQTTATNKSNYQVRSYRYEYKKRDLKEHIDAAVPIDVQQVKVTSATLSTDHKRVSLHLDSLRPGFIYEFTLGDIKSVDGRLLPNRLICYTLNRLR